MGEKPAAKRDRYSKVIENGIRENASPELAERKLQELGQAYLLFGSDFSLAEQQELTPEKIMSPQAGGDIKRTAEKRAVPALDSEKLAALWHMPTTEERAQLTQPIRWAGDDPPVSFGRSRYAYSSKLSHNRPTNGQVKNQG